MIIPFYYTSADKQSIFINMYGRWFKTLSHREASIYIHVYTNNLLVYMCSKTGFILVLRKKAESFFKNSNSKAKILKIIK